MDGDFRSQTARMPSWLRPDRLETPTHILLVKSDFKKRLETIRYAAACIPMRLPYPIRAACIHRPNLPHAPAGNSHPKLPRLTSCKTPSKPLPYTPHLCFPPSPPPSAWQAAPIQYPLWAPTPVPPKYFPA